MADAGAVLARIEDFTVGGPDGHDAFLARLAAENDWSRETAVRAWQEYLRFIALAGSSPDRPRVPSQAVDAVWHLHLTYSRSYWEDLKPLLNRELHHEPAGPDGEQTDGPYRETIAAYTASFGPPPRDLWPRPAVPPAPPFRRSRRWLAVPFVVAVIALVGLLGIGHPITLVVIVAGVGAWFCRQVQRERSGPGATPSPNEEPG